MSNYPAKTDVSGIITILNGEIVEVNIGAPGRVLSKIEQLIALRNVVTLHLKEYEKNYKRS